MMHVGSLKEMVDSGSGCKDRRPPEISFLPGKQSSQPRSKAPDQQWLGQSSRDLELESRDRHFRDYRTCKSCVALCLVVEPSEIIFLI